jgi:hypothetical protein
LPGKARTVEPQRCRRVVRAGRAEPQVPPACRSRSGWLPLAAAGGQPHAAGCEGQVSGCAAAELALLRLAGTLRAGPRTWARPGPLAWF